MGLETLPGWKDRRPADITPVRGVAVGDVLGGTYRLTRPIQRGGMGEVFLATHERLPMEFAVKVLSPSLFDAEGFAQLQREAAVLARLRHPNIVQLVDFNWTDGGLPYLVMEHLPGTDLAELLMSQPRLAPEQIFGILHQAACGLYAAHHAGIAHLDLKPSNMMVVHYEGRASLIKLIDFGIAVVQQAQGGGDIAGTPQFMSPEQIYGSPEQLGPASDQFALGVIAYLLFAGALPWAGEGAELTRAIANLPPPPLPCEEPHAAVEEVLCRALAKSPAQRFPSTLAFARALRRAMGSDGYLPDFSAEGRVATSAPASAHGTGRRLATATVRMRRSASHRAEPRRGRRSVGVLLVGVALAAVAWFVPPAHSQAAQAWKMLRGYATQAVQVCATEGRSLINAARGEPNAAQGEPTP